MAMGEAGVRTGMTTIQIEHLKQVYGRDPNAYGANTLDMHARLETPWLSARMREEIDVAFDPRARAHAVHKGRRLPQPVPPEKQMVGGLLLNRADVQASMVSSRSGASTARRDLRSARLGLRGEGRGGVEQEEEEAVTAGLLATCRSCSTGRDSARSGAAQQSARGSTRRSARATARGTARGSARSRSGVTRDSARAQTARLQAQKDALADQLLAVSRQLKTAVCATKLDPAFTPALIKSDGQSEEYDRATGYRCLMRTRNTSIHQGDFGQDHFDRPLSPKEFARTRTDMGDYGERLAKTKAALRGPF